MATLISQSGLPQNIFFIGYTTIDQAKNKGNVSDDPQSLNIWYNPGGHFKKSVVFMPYGKRDRDEYLSPTIRYIEWNFPSHKLFFVRVIAGAFQLARAVRFSLSILKTEKIDVVRANGPHIPALVVWLMSAFHKLPTLIFIEAFWEELLSSQSYMPKWLQKLLPFWYKHVVYKTFDIYCGTPSTSPAYYTQLGVDLAKISSWVQEVDLEYISERAIKAKTPDNIDSIPHPRLVAVGRLHPEKHPDDLIKLIAVLKPKFPTLQLILIGGGDVESMRMLAAELEVSDCVHFTGGLSQEIGLAIVSKSDIYVAPMQGNALLEAMSVGIPIVGYDHVSHRGLIRHGETGILVEHRNVHAMADEVSKLIEAPELGENMGLNAKKHALNCYGSSVVVATLRAPYIAAFNIRPHR